MAAVKYIRIPSYPGIQDKPAATFNRHPPSRDAIGLFSIYVTTHSIPSTSEREPVKQTSKQRRRSKTLTFSTCPSTKHIFHHTATTSAYSNLAYRPAPCRNLSRSGTCRFGTRCRYSHDLSDAQSRPPPAETPCFHWEEKGACPVVELRM